MSWQATHWVIENSTHKGSALLTLLCIANCANEDGSDCWPSKERLSRDTRLSQRQLSKIINMLEASGELGVKRSVGRVPNHYFLPLMCTKNNGDKMTGLTKQTPSTKAPNPVISRLNPVIASSPDPSVEQSKNDQRRMFALLGEKQGAIPDPEVQGKAIKWLLKSHSRRDCEMCLEFLLSQTWRTSRVSWLTVRNQIGAWKAGQLNGHKTQAEMNRGGRGNGVVI